MAAGGLFVTRMWREFWFVSEHRPPVAELAGVMLAAIRIHPAKPLSRMGADNGLEVVLVCLSGSHALERNHGLPRQPWRDRPMMC